MPKVSNIVATGVRRTFVNFQARCFATLTATVPHALAVPVPWFGVIPRYIGIFHIRPNFVISAPFDLIGFQQTGWLRSRRRSPVTLVISQTLSVARRPWFPRPAHYLSAEFFTTANHVIWASARMSWRVESVWGTQFHPVYQECRRLTKGGGPA